MPRRSGHDLSHSVAARLAALAAFGLGAAACQGTDPDNGCRFTREVTAPASPLMLLADARLERAGGALVLVGVDADRATVRWAGLDPTTGTLGAEQSAALTPGAAGPWLAITSNKTPGDTLLAATVTASGNDAELHLAAFPAATSTPMAPPLGPVFAVIPGGLAKGATPTVALGASRSGPHAALAWIDPTAGAVMELVLSAGGEPIGDPQSVETAPAFACLAFAPGKSALTLVYHKYAAATSRTPRFVIKELADAGTVDSTLELILEAHAASCPQLTPTAAGYAIAFQDAEASWLGVYDDPSGSLAINPFAAAVAFGGAALQPPLTGLAPMGTDFGVVLERNRGGELWRLSAGGAHRAGRLAFPTLKGTTGHIATASDSDVITATYADYSDVGADGAGTAGQRVFLGMTCQ